MAPEDGIMMSATIEEYLFGVDFIFDRRDKKKFPKIICPQGYVDAVQHSSQRCAKGGVLSLVCAIG